MMYWVLLVALSLSVFVLTHTVAVLAVGAVLRCGRQRLERMQAAEAANTLVALRVLPVTVAALFVAVIAAPAFLRHEPLASEQYLSAKVIVLAALAAALILSTAAQVTRLLLHTRALTQQWQRSSQRIFVAGATMPVYRFEQTAAQMAVVGLLRPCLYVSSGALALLDTDELQAAVAHEAAHHQAGDLWKQLVMRTLPDVLPGTGMWSAGLGIFARKIEEAADERGTRERRNAVSLASALVKFARCQNMVSRPAMLGAYLVEEHADVPALAARIQQLLAARREVAGSASQGRMQPVILCALFVGLALVDYQAVLKQSHDLLEMLAK